MSGCAESKDDADQDDQPLYMCIKIGKRFNLVPGQGGSFVRTRLRAEYWFNIPPDRYEFPLSKRRCLG